jgi:hypothetical protein
MSEATQPPNQPIEATRKPVSLDGLDSPIDVEANPEVPSSPQVDGTVTRAPVSLDGARSSPKNDRDLETEIVDKPTGAPEVVREPVVINDEATDQEDPDRGPKNTG